MPEVFWKKPRQTPQKLLKLITKGVTRSGRGHACQEAKRLRKHCIVNYDTALTMTPAFSGDPCHWFD